MTAKLPRVSTPSKINSRTKLADPHRTEENGFSTLYYTCKSHIRQASVELAHSTHSVATVTSDNDTRQPE